jgi:nucleoside-diphosphate-sugar epimerase
VHTIQADLDLTETLADLPSAGAIIYYLAPPPQTGKRDTRLDNFLATIGPQALPKKIIYISTSGVYGDCHGEHVSEETPPAPLTGRARRRLASEQTLLDWAAKQDVATVILRVGGIYGPGRLPLERLRQGMPVLRRDLAPISNRIHADDLALVCHAAAAAPGKHTLYNVCDNQPSSMTDYFIAVAHHAGLPAPQEIDWQEAETRLSPEILSWMRESRRMDNSKLVRELGIKLAYPILEEGLPSCFVSA